MKPLLAFVLASAAAAQTEEPSFRANTQLVEVDVVVQGAVRGKDRSVAGLGKDDFSVSDNGKPQTIATFRVIGANDRVSARQLPPGVVTNRLANSGEEAAGVTVLLMDRLNTDVGDQAEVRRQLLHYLQTAPPGERIAIYSLNKTLRVIQDFTEDPERLRKMVSARNSPESSVDLTADLFADDLPVTGDAMTDAMIQNAANEMKDAAMANRVRITAFALRVIGKHLAGLHGRKKLVWFTSAFPAEYSYTGQRNGRKQIEARQFSDEIDRAARALNDANVAVYPVDPRGLMEGFDAVGIDTMNLFAGKTGGRAFYMINDMESAIRAVEEDDEVTYALGYYPSNMKLDGAYHSIAVKVARRATEVRYRKGYFASAAKLPTEQKKKAALAEAFSNPLEATTIGLAGRATPAPDKPGTYNLDLSLNLNELHLERQGEGNQARWVALISIATEFSGKKKPNGSLEEIKLSLTEDRLKQALRTGYLLRRPFPAGQLTGELRVVVQDRVTGDAGSVRLPIRQTSQ